MFPSESWRYQYRCPWPPPSHLTHQQGTASPSEPTQAHLSLSHCLQPGQTSCLLLSRLQSLCFILLLQTLTATPVHTCQVTSPLCQNPSQGPLLSWGKIQHPHCDPQVPVLSALGPPHLLSYHPPLTHLLQPHWSPTSKPLHLLTFYPPTVPSLPLTLFGEPCLGTSKSPPCYLSSSVLVFFLTRFTV